MDATEIIYKKFYCKSCSKVTLYGFAYCGWCTLKIQAKERANSKFSFPKFGSNRGKQHGDT